MRQRSGQCHSRPLGHSIRGSLPPFFPPHHHAPQSYGHAGLPSSRSAPFRPLACAGPTRVVAQLFARRSSLTAWHHMCLVSGSCSFSTRSAHSVSISHVSVLLLYRVPSFPYRVPHFLSPGIPHTFSFHSSWVCLTDPCCPCFVLGWGGGCDQHLLESKVFHANLVVPVSVGSALLALKRPLRAFLLRESHEFIIT